MNTIPDWKLASCAPTKEAKTALINKARNDFPSLLQSAEIARRDALQNITTD